MTPNPASLRPLAALLLAAAAGAASANDFPTVERVLYVQECVATHPGPQYEMVNKCACALDAMAREAPSMQKDIKRYKELQSKAEKGCFLGAAVPR